MHVAIDDQLLFTLAGNRVPEASEVHTLVDRALRLVSEVSHKFPERVLVLGQDDLELIERRLGVYQQIDSAERLYARLNQLAGVSLDHVQLDFSPAHLDEIARLAEGQGCEPAILVARMLKTLTSDFFKARPAQEAPFVLYVDRDTREPLDVV